MTFDMTQKEAHALATYIALIRDRSGGPAWHKAGIADALGRARTVAPSPDLAIAAIRAAREPSNRTPAVIGLEGPHWQGSKTPPRRPYDSTATCASCGFSQPECRRRWSEDHEFESVQQAKARREAEADAEAVHRRTLGVREAMQDEPPTHEEPAPGTEGTERVAAIREAMTNPNPAPPTVAADQTTQPSGLGTQEGERDGKQGGVHPDRAGQAAEGSDGRGIHVGPGVLDRAGLDPEGRRTGGAGRRLTIAPTPEQRALAWVAPETNAPTVAAHNQAAVAADRSA